MSAGRPAAGLCQNALKYVMIPFVRGRETAITGDGPLSRGQHEGNTLDSLDGCTIDGGCVERMQHMGGAR